MVAVGLQLVELVHFLVGKLDLLVVGIPARLVDNLGFIFFAVELLLEAHLVDV